MKFAAIKGKMGIWDYYVSVLTFGDVANYVSPITEEISNSESYSNLLQRSITSNVEDIKEYLLKQNERFFNAIVLAVYNGDPKWNELEIDLELFHSYSVGFLEFTGEEIIFPVDGQHRVAGIKDAIAENPVLESQEVPIILIGHQNTSRGKQRTRRLFSTLNRRAKKVDDNQIIALDEDDVVAIITRDMAENYPLFSGFRLIDTNTKSMPIRNTTAFTNLLTLYEVNKILYSYKAKCQGMTQKQIEKYLYYRPDENDINMYSSFILEYWDSFSEGLPIIKEYLTLNEDEAEKKSYRGNEGGNILFRSMTLSQFTEAVIRCSHDKDISLQDTIRLFSKIPMTLQEKPWKNFFWLEERKNISGRIGKDILQSMILFLVDRTLLKEAEERKLVNYILSQRDLDVSSYQSILDELNSYALT